jgi:oligopeptide/dipeptide ABC transporter ATP-binding protein
MSHAHEADPVLKIEGLTTEFATRRGVIRAVDGVSLSVNSGEKVGIVGESGSGKSVTMLSALRLLPEPAGRVVAGKIVLGGIDMLAATRRQLRTVRGATVGYIFQDTLSALNPVVTIGTQMIETIRVHDRSVSRREAAERSTAMLERVGLSNPSRRLRQYPHELSGGMRQRVMIGISIINEPRLIVADEPTTALDVTVQAQILELLRGITEETGAALILITHDLGVVAETVDRVEVMYAGRIVETASVAELFHSPAHPYTVGLLATRPRVAGRSRLRAIPGQPVSLAALPPGCRFHPRCSWSRDQCVARDPALGAVGRDHTAACHFADEVQAAAVRRHADAVMPSSS